MRYFLNHTITTIRHAKRCIPQSVGAILVASLAVSGLVIGLKQFGLFQSLEMQAFDAATTWEHQNLPDPRLLIVGVTEEDIQALRQPTLSDATLARLITRLQQYRPRVIGVDLYRDVPQEPGNAEFLKAIQAKNVVVITNLGSSDGDDIPAPPGVAESQIGFNDLLVDADGVVRRNLLFGTIGDQTFSSFSYQLATRYLASQAILPKPSQRPDWLQLGQAVFIPLEPNSGAYQEVDASGYQVLLEYRTQRPIAHQVSVTDLLYGRIDPNWIADKVVLIGNLAASSKDLFYTPYSAKETIDHQMFGVEVHAQSVSQLISAALGEQSLTTFWPEWVEWVWILGWALLSSSLAWFVRHPFAISISTLGVVATLIGLSVVIVHQQQWIPLISPPLAVVMAVGVVVTYQAQQAHRQRQMVMTLLGQNTSPEIAQALWDSRDRLVESGKLPGQRLVATMLFTDIRGFSQISEELPPEELLEWLNEYLEAMTDEIQAHHGIINKFTGDGLLAVFGVPMPRMEQREIAQDAYWAVSCALAMSDRLQTLNQHWQSRGKTTIQMRVGIFTGPVVVGSLGGKDRLEYGVIGDSVNIASRLESCAKEQQVSDCRILVAQDTLTQVEGKFVVEAWGAMQLKGKQQSVDVFRVLDHASQASEAVIACRETVKPQPEPPIL